MTQRISEEESAFQKYRIQKHNWLLPGIHKFARVDGGRIEVAKAFLSGWQYMSTPDSVEACVKVYNDPTVIDRLLKAKFNHIFVTWSVGFAREDELLHQKELIKFIDKIKSHGIKVSTYISLTNMFRDSMLKYTPEASNWIQMSHEGNEMPYGAAKYFGDNITRVIACLRNDGWIEYQNMKFQEAMQADVDGIYLDNVVQNCYCTKCKSAWAEYTKNNFGQKLAPPIPPKKHFWGRNIDDAFETTGEQDFDSKHLKIWEDFNLQHIKSVLLNIKNLAITYNPKVVLSCNSHHLPYLDDVCDFNLNEDGYEPGIHSDKEDRFGYFSHISIGDTISNKSMSLFAIAPDKYGISRTFVNELGKRIASTRNDGAMPPRKQKIAIFESAVYGGCMATYYEGMFLTDLYRRKRKSIEAHNAIEQAQHFIEENAPLFNHRQYTVPYAVVSERNSTILSRLSDMQKEFAVMKPHKLSTGFIHEFKSIFIAQASTLTEAAINNTLKFLENGGQIAIDNSFAVYDENYNSRKPLEQLNIKNSKTISRMRVGKGTLVHFDGRWDVLSSKDIQSCLLIDGIMSDIEIEAPPCVQYHTAVNDANNIIIYLINYSDVPIDKTIININTDKYDSKRIELSACLGKLNTKICTKSKIAIVENLDIGAILTLPS